MDAFTESVIAGLVSNALTLWGQCAIGAYRRVSADMVLAKGDVATLIQRGISALSRQLNQDESSGRQIVGKFLTSPEVDSLMRQVFAVWVAGQNDEVKGRSEEIKSLEKVFVACLSIATNKPVEEIRSQGQALFQALIKTCRRIIEVAINNGSLSAKDAKDAARHRWIVGELEAINKKLAFMERHRMNYSAIEQFEQQYRSQVAFRTRSVNPPFLTDSQPVPIDDIYVAPHLRNAYSENRISIYPFMKTLHRAVLLGEQGAGKSTLVQRISHDLAQNYEQKLVAGAKLTPVIVVLREYARAKDDEGKSIIEFIEQQARTVYQLPTVPSRAFEFLLHNGRLFVIFDGLDELLLTHKRDQIKGDVEAFCQLFPSTPVLVTSRIVGYREAPLDEGEFPSFTIRPFNDELIENYAARWFKSIPHLSNEERKKKFLGFRQDIRSVHDLCANPLMLALLCHLYRVENYIPRNRPQVYRNCSELMIEKWDRSRGIIYPFSETIPLYETIQHISNWVYGNEARMSGVTLASLIDEVTNYLLNKRFEDRDSALKAAEEFVRFCRLRASVFSDAGLDKNGNELYRFSHQTFLEYFAALYLARTKPVGELLKHLLPRIKRREWDHLCQMTFRLKAEQEEGADDQAIREILNEAKSLDALQPRECINCFAFVARSLGHLTPRPATIRKIVEAIVFCQISVLLQSHRDHSCDAFTAVPSLVHNYNSDDIIGTLRNALPDNQQTIKTSLDSALFQSLEDRADKADRQRMAAALLYEFTKLFRETLIQWSSQTLASFITALNARWRDDLKLASIALYTDVGACTITEFCSQFGAITMFRRVPSRVVANTYDNSIALTVLNFWMQGHYALRPDLAIMRNILTQIATTLAVLPTPWFKCGGVTGLEKTRLEPLVQEQIEGALRNHYLPWTTERKSEEVFGAFVLLASLYEIHGQKNLTADLVSSTHPLYQQFGKIFGVREGDIFGKSDEYITNAGIISQPFSGIVRKWMHREIDFSDGLIS